MKAIEQENDDLKDVLPKSYQRVDNATLVELLKIMSSIPLDIPGDAFGKPGRRVVRGCPAHLPSD